MEPRITIQVDGQVFDGVARDIVNEMKSSAFGAESMTLAEFIADRAANMFDDPSRVTGSTDREMCSSLIAAMLDTGIAREFNPDEDDKTVSPDPQPVTETTTEDKE